MSVPQIDRSGRLSATAVFKSAPDLQTPAPPPLLCEGGRSLNGRSESEAAVTGSGRGEDQLVHLIPHSLGGDICLSFHLLKK